MTVGRMPTLKDIGFNAVDCQCPRVERKRQHQLFIPRAIVMFRNIDGMSADNVHFGCVRSLLGDRFWV